MTEETSFEEALDTWAVDHLEAAIALRAIIRKALEHTGHRQIGKAIARLELPQPSEPWQPQVYASRKPGG
jgi:hypothetical protein